MQAYKNLSGDSGVTHYELRPGSLTLRFRNGDTYLYDRRHPGPRHLARMQTLARRGQGLATYVSQHVRHNYAAKLSAATTPPNSAPQPPSGPAQHVCGKPAPDPEKTVGFFKNAPRLPGKTTVNDGTFSKNRTASTHTL